MKGLFVRAKNAVKRELRDLKQALKACKAERTKRTYTTSGSGVAVKHSTNKTRAEHLVRVAQRQFPNQRRGRYLATYPVSFWK